MHVLAFVLVSVGVAFGAEGSVAFVTAVQCVWLLGLLLRLDAVARPCSAGLALLIAPDT